MLISSNRTRKLKQKLFPPCALHCLENSKYDLVQKVIKSQFKTDRYRRKTKRTDLKHTEHVMLLISCGLTPSEDYVIHCCEKIYILISVFIVKVKFKI